MILGFGFSCFLGFCGFVGFGFVCFVCCLRFWTVSLTFCGFDIIRILLGFGYFGVF